MCLEQQLNRPRRQPSPGRDHHTSCHRHGGEQRGHILGYIRMQPWVMAIPTAIGLLVREAYNCAQPRAAWRSRPEGLSGRARTIIGTIRRSPRALCGLNSGDLPCARVGAAVICFTAPTIRWRLECHHPRLHPYVPGGCGRAVPLVPVGTKVWLDQRPGEGCYVDVSCCSRHIRRSTAKGRHGAESGVASQLLDKALARIRRQYIGTWRVRRCRARMEFPPWWACRPSSINHHRPPMQRRRRPRP